MDTGQWTSPKESFFEANLNNMMMTTMSSAGALEITTTTLFMIVYNTGSELVSSECMTKMCVVENRGHIFFKIVVTTIWPAKTNKDEESRFRKLL